MNCQQVNKLLERYDEGDLTPQISIQVETHLQSCSNCQTKLRLVEKERLCLQSGLDIPPLESDFAQNVMARITVSSPPVLPPLVPIWVEWIRRYPTLLGAAAVILLFIFPVFGQPYQNQEVLPTTNTVKQVATLEKAQNVNYDTTLPAQPFEAPTNSYYSEDRQVTREGPSRSSQTQPQTGGMGSPAPTMKTRAIAEETITDSQSLAPAVIPSYIPDGYILDKIEISDDNQVTVSYLTNNNNEHNTAPLVINIVPAIPAPNTDSPAAAAANKEEVIPQVKMLTAPPAPLEDGLTKAQGAYGTYNYLITTNSPLNQKEMDNLLNSLAPRPSE